MTRRRSFAAAITVGATITAVLTGCVSNSPAEGGPIAVTSTDSECTVSANTAKSGTIAFDVANRGSQVTEFYLLADDGLRIVGEVENIAPGASRSLTATVQPGNYFTLCKPGMVGLGVGKAPFTVTGDRVAIEGPDAEFKQQAIELYAAFVKDQVVQLVPETQAFGDLYLAGQDEPRRQSSPTCVPSGTLARRSSLSHLVRPCGFVGETLLG